MARRGRKRDGKAPLSDVFKVRLKNLRAKHPELSREEAVERVKDQWRTCSPEGLKRKIANLSPGNPRSKRVKVRAAERDDYVPLAEQEERSVQDSDIIQFAEGWLGLSFEERPAQRVILKAIYGLPLDDGELRIYGELAGGALYTPGEERAEVVMALGRRSGKSFLISVCALYEAIVRGSIWRQCLRPGEVGYAIVVATRQKQAEDVIQRNCAQLLSLSRLRSWIGEEPLKAELTLRNGLKIISLPCNTTAGRGLPAFFLAFDEVAHFYTEGPKADVSIHSSLSPAQAQFPGAKKTMISTPAAKQGLFWEWFKEGFEVPGRLTMQAPTKLINPMISDEFLEREKRQDLDNYLREFEAQFAEQMDAFFPADKLGACFVLSGDLAPQGGHSYACGIDQSGLTGRDRFAAAVAHMEGNTAKVDWVRSWDTTQANDVLPEIQRGSAEYGFASVMIDRFAGGWVTNALAEKNLSTEVRPMLPQVYLNAKTLMIAGRLQLPDNGDLRAGMVNTMGFYGRNNSLSISHARSERGHADEADAVCTAVWAASREPEFAPCTIVDQSGVIG